MKEKYDPLGRLISILYRSSQSHISKELEPYGIGSGQVSFLAELTYQDGVSQEELASFFKCDKATATRALQHLESQGYVERKRSPEDGRVNLVYLTPKGSDFKPTLRKILYGSIEILVEGFSDEERHQVMGLLNRMVENASNLK
ncbi:MarR family winged helix-turn-helix transcriptional regulator [Vibrio sp. RC27]